MWRLLSLNLVFVSFLWSIEVAQGNFSWPTTTGQFTPITGLSFAPKVLIMHWTESGASGTVTPGSSLGFGMAVKDPHYQMLVYQRASDGSANADSIQRNDSIMQTITSASAVIARGTLQPSFWLSNGITINAVNASSSIIANVGWLVLGGDDLTNTSIVQYTSPTSTGTQALTGAGFSPTAVIIVTLSIDTAPNGTRDNADVWPGFGIATPTSQAATGYLARNATTNHRRAQSTSHVVYTPDQSAMRLVASVQSFDADGITLNWTTVQSTGLHFWVMYLKGPTFGVVNFLQPTATGDQSYNVTTFQPKAGLFLSHCTIADTAIQTHGQAQVGTVVSTTARALHNTALNATGGSTVRLFRSDRALTCLSNPSGGNADQVVQANLVSWNSNGFTLNWNPVDTTQRQFIGLLFGDGGGKRRGVVIQ